MSANEGLSPTARASQVWINQDMSWLSLVGIKIHRADVHLSRQVECYCHSSKFSPG